MMIIAVGWIIMGIAVQGLASPKSLEATGGVSPILVSPYWLVSLYFILTTAACIGSCRYFDVPDAQKAGAIYPNVKERQKKLLV
jgi:hypothetical protein